MNRFEWGAASTALEFDGVNDHVAVNGGVNLANSSFTLEAWAARHTSGSAGLILGQGAAANNQGLHFGFRPNNLFTFAFYANDLDTPAAFTDTDWHHWAGTYDAVTKMRCLYRDGTLVASNTASANYTGTGPLLMGDLPWGGWPFDGQIDDVRIWNVPLSAADIRANLHTRLAGNEPGLVAYYLMDEGAGTTTADASGHGLTGTLVNDPTWSPGARPVFDQVTSWQPVAGTNSVLNLDGVDDYVDVPDAVWFNSEFTIETWVYERSFNSWARIIDFGNSGPTDNVLFAPSAATTGRPSLVVAPGSSAQQRLDAPDPIPLNQWVHLAATLSSNIGDDLRQRRGGGLAHDDGAQRRQP